MLSQSSSTCSHKMFLCLPETLLGKEAVNATLPVGVVMCRAIRNYYQRVGYKVHFIYSHYVHNLFFLYSQSKVAKMRILASPCLFACNNFTTAEKIFMKTNMRAFYGNISVRASFC